MKKITSLVIALVVSLCSLTAWATEREAPTVPANTAPVSEQTYYLYNVERGLFLSSYNTIGESPLSVLVTIKDNGAYTFKNGASASYISAYGSGNMQTWSNANTSYAYWSIAESEGSYTIYCSPLNTNYYAEGQYLGTVEGSTTLRHNRTADDQIHWRFIPADEVGDHFVAEMKLYRALSTLDGVAWPPALTAHFEALYNNRASQTPELLTNTAHAILNCTGMSQGYKARYWNEYPILWETPAGSFGQNYNYTWALPNSSTDINGNTIQYSSGSYFYTYFSATTGSRTLSATVSVDELSTFVYSTSGTDYYDSKIEVYVDDVLVRTLIGPQISTYPSDKTYARFFEVLQPGTHTIKWVASTTNSNSQYFYVRSAGVVKSPLITVSLLEPGSLGTEVLYNTDHIKKVRRLKVIGKMNDDDWAKLKMMSGLLDLDLSEAEFAEVPEGQFRVTSGDTVMQFLHRLVLPEGVTKINKEAFYYSFIDTLALPSTLRTMSEKAFYGSHIQEINMPDDCTEIYGPETYESYNSYPVFSYMKWLRKLKCAKNWTMIPYQTFYDCNFLEEVTLPEKLEAIGEGAFGYNRYMTTSFPEGLKRINYSAFYNCYLATFGAFPEGLKTIGSYAFYNCSKIVNLVVPGNVSTLGSNAFENCSGLKTAEMGVSQYALANNLFTGCNGLTTLRLNSPTVATANSSNSYYPVAADRLKYVDLIVPSYLVNAYKLDKYWYNFKSITGFSTAEIQDWVINNPMVMNHDRFEGNPNISINGNYSRMPSLKFNGTAAQNINNLFLNGYIYYASSNLSNLRCKNFPGQIYSNCNNIMVNGNVRVCLNTEANRWYFFSLPFDMKVSDITHGESDVQYKIGYYDGAERALYGTNGSWKNIKGKPLTDTEGWDLTTEYTETLNSYSSSRVSGASIIIGENGEVANSTTTSNNVKYVLLNTDKDNQIKIRVNEGYKVTGLAITAWSNNTSSQADRSIILNGAYIDGSFTSVLTENVTFPGGSVGRTPTTATLEGLEATKLIRLTFDNSLIVSSDVDYYGYHKQIYATIDVTYKRVVPEEDEGMAIIPAGTGFIMQTNKTTWNYFYAVNNATKQNLVSNQEIVKALEFYPSEKKANTGWNLVGNPWQCFYNSHCLNFTAPITVWDAYNKKYVAYSITDDDYAIRPNEAFFVQCPSEEYNTIGFPVQGRQFTDVIESQNAAPAKNPGLKERRLIDVVLTSGDKGNDNTRVVLNEKAKLDYEMTCDASKFMSMDNSVPQLFTLDAEGTQYAINERPLSDGIVKLGLYVSKSGTYTISIGRCDMDKVMLLDYETGETIDISYGEYSFSTDAGTFTNRFELVFDAENDADGLKEFKNSEDRKDSEDAIYNIAGQRINADKMRGIYILNGKKVIK